MRVASSADWRDGLAFETPVLLVDLMSGEDARCFTCGPDSELLPRTQLWAFKHRHPKHHNGYVRFYCREHVPVVRPTTPTLAPVTPRTRPPRAERPDPVRRPHPNDTVRAMCPNCFIEVSATGLCGVCGAEVG